MHVALVVCVSGICGLATCTSTRTFMEQRRASSKTTFTIGKMFQKTFAQSFLRASSKLQAQRPSLGPLRGRTTSSPARGGCTQSRCEGPASQRVVSCGSGRCSGTVGGLGSIALDQLVVAAGCVFLRNNRFRRQLRVVSTSRPEAL